jgi:hypothetical protein
MKTEGREGMMESGPMVPVISVLMRFAGYTLEDGPQQGCVVEKWEWRSKCGRKGAVPCRRLSHIPQRTLMVALGAQGLGGGDGGERCWAVHLLLYQP